MVSSDLPNLLLAGIPKAGTSSLFSYLAQHPDICASKEKEPGYFSALIPAAGVLPPIDSYTRNFEHCSHATYVMEATPSYCYGGPRVINSVKEILGRPRSVLILRDPIERLWSAYTFQRSLGNLPGISTFEDYIARCQHQRDSGTPFIIRSHLNGLSIGFYGEYVPDWMEAFGSDVKVIFFEEMTRSPGSVVTGLCGWLSIDSDLAATFDYTPQNVTAHPRSTTLSRLAFGVKAKTDVVFRRLPFVRRALLATYRRVNTGAMHEMMDPDTKYRLEGLYRDSNRRVAEVMRAHGYENLPPWMVD